MPKHACGWSFNGSVGLLTCGVVSKPGVQISAVLSATWGYQKAFMLLLDGHPTAAIRHPRTLWLCSGSCSGFEIQAPSLTSGRCCQSLGVGHEDLEECVGGGQGSVLRDPLQRLESWNLPHRDLAHWSIPGTDLAPGRCIGVSSVRSSAMVPGLV
eukprot:1567966-Rhodomonas_salina.2